MAFMEVATEHGKGWLKDGGHSWGKEGLSHFLSSFFLLHSLADMSKAPPDTSATSKHQNLFHCDITDMMACEITMSEVEGTDYLDKHLLGLSHPTRLGNKHISVHLTDNTVKPTWNSTPAGHKLVPTDHPKVIPKMHCTIPLQFY